MSRGSPGTATMKRPRLNTMASSSGLDAASEPVTPASGARSSTPGIWTLLVEVVTCIAGWAGPAPGLLNATVRRAGSQRTTNSGSPPAGPNQASGAAPGR